MFELPPGLPPQRAVDHQIVLKEGQGPERETLQVRPCPEIRDREIDARDVSRWENQAK